MKQKRKLDTRYIRRVFGPFAEELLAILAKSAGAKK